MDHYTHDGLTFDVTDTGPGNGSDDPVIALHGFPQDRHCWSDLAEALAGAGRRTLAPDQRGYSPGARPSERRAYSLDILGDDVLALADAAGAKRFDLLGHDFGAAVAWNLAAKHPDRVRSLTALSVPHPSAFKEAMTSSTQVLRSWYMLFFQLPLLPERVLSRGGGSFLASGLERNGLDHDTAERYAQRARTPATMTGLLNWYRALPFEFRRAPGPVTVPTLYVWGSGDRFVTRAAAQRCGDHVKAPYRFVVLEDEPHWLPTAASAKLAPLIVDHLARANARVQS